MDAPVRSPERVDSPPSVPDLSRLRVALVHDWLTGRRGGEKCLEVLCRAFPQAIVHTLLHRQGALGEPIESMAIRTSPLQRLPGIHRHYRKLLPLMPLAARTWKPGEVDLVVSLSHCVAKAIRVPEGVPHVCYCFTPMRYAWDGRDAYLDGWSGRPFTRTLAGWTLDRLRAWDRATAARVTHFIAISQTIRERIQRCYDRDSVVIPPPVDTEFYHPAPVAREPFYLCLSALVPYKRIDHAIRACTASNRPLTIIGEGPDRARLEVARRLLGPLPGLAARQRRARPPPPLPGPAVSRNRGFRHRSGRGPRVRNPRHRARSRRRLRDRRFHHGPPLSRAISRRPAPRSRILGNRGLPLRRPRRPHPRREPFDLRLPRRPLAPISPRLWPDPQPPRTASRHRISPCRASLPTHQSPLQRSPGHRKRALYAGNSRYFPGGLTALGAETRQDGCPRLSGPTPTRTSGGRCIGKRRA